MNDKLAILGGNKAKPSPYGRGLRFDERELCELRDAVTQNDLFYFSGKKTAEFCRQACEYFGKRYCVTTSSGTAALHTAVLALEIPPGFEVITSPITDIGTLCGLLYQNLIPVFADLDPHSYNLTADTIRARITDRTRAIIAVHLAGNPCEMDEILALGRERGIPVIEDVAQSYNAIYKGRKAGTMAELGCFSLNGFKHISSGDGGFVLTDSEELFYRLHNYADKFYDRHKQGIRLHKLAPCYRITELQSAVGIAQLRKLSGITDARGRLGDKLTALLAGLDCLTAPLVRPGNRSSYWFYMFRIIPERLSCTRQEFSAALAAEGVENKGGYLERAIYLEKLFTEKRFFPGGIWPAEMVSGRTYDYRPGLCPVAERILETAILLPMNEFFTDQDIEETAAAIRKVARAYAK